MNIAKLATKLINPASLTTLRNIQRVPISTIKPFISSTNFKLNINSHASLVKRLSYRFSNDKPPNKDPKKDPKNNKKA